MKKVSEYKINVYGKGTVNVVEDTLIDDGAASDSVNFLTLPDRIELIGGRRLIGAEESGNQGVLGMGEIIRVNGEKIIFRKIGTKLQYFNNSTQLWVDIKTDLIDGEPLWFANSFTPAGRQVWMCGEDGLFKLYPSSPTSIITLTYETKNYRGKILIDKSRMICIRMKKDPTGIRFSKVDKDSNYQHVSNEAITDTATGKKHYTGTLAFKAGGATRGCFGIAFTDGVYIVRDDKDGNLIGNGTGTINYATGEYEIDFAFNTANPVTAEYSYEDSLNNGLADFDYSATRLAGEGNVLRQDATGSQSMFVVNFNNSFITLQDKGSWRLTIDSADTKWDNEVYRENIGCPSPRAGVVSADGVIFIDTYDKDNPKLRLLALNQFGDQLIPYDLGKDRFKLENFTFDKDTCLYKKGDWVLISCKQNSPVNNKLIIYNIKQKSFDVSNYYGNCFVDLNNKVIAGDSTSPNVYELFTGYDDLDYNVEGSWEGKKHNLKSDRLKKFKVFRANGYIDPDQSFAVMASYDNEPYVQIGHIVWRGTYVDPQKNYAIGSSMIGEEIVGLGDSSKASYFETEFKVKTPKFKRVKIAFVPTGLGYLSILEHSFTDIRVKNNKLPKKYREVKGSGIGFMQVGSTFQIK